MSKKYMMIMVVLMALVLMVLPVSATIGKYIDQGATVYLGEEGLDITKAMNTSDTQIGWYASAANIYTTSPNQVIDVSSRLTSFEVTTSEFSGYTGSWYRLNTALSSPTNVAGIDGIAFTVAEPKISVSIRNGINDNSVDGKTVTRGIPLQFKLDTNVMLNNKRGDLTVITPAQPAVANITQYNPHSNFTVSGTGATVYFTDTSSGSPDSWIWDFGDASTATVKNPFRTYGAPGTYKVTLSSANSSVTGGSTLTTANITVSSGAVVVDNISTDYVQTGSPYVIPGHAAIDAVTGIIPATEGYINVTVKSSTGTKYSSIINMTNVPASLSNQFISTSPFYWNNGDKWNTSAKDSNGFIYQSGVYSVFAECMLNGINDNYKVTGKSVSETQTVTLGSDTLSLEVSKDSVVRGKTFSVTIAGQPDTDYTLYLKGISASATNAPTFVSYQDGVTPISNNASTVRTDNSGTRIVAFTTSSETKDQKYTLRVANIGSTKTDEVTITVTKGGVTIVASGDQVYYLGEEIKLSGTNTETDTTYLFMVGPNLNSNGVMLEGDLIAVDNLDENTFTIANVESDDTFKFDWETSQIDVDAGTYTVYAVSNPVDKSHLSDSSYGTVSITIKKPYVSASVSQPTVAKGDKLFIEGTAEGNPSSVNIWILGKNYVKIASQSVDSDSTYKYEFGQGDTENLASGQYFVVVQHPMQNGVFDVVQEGQYVINKQLNSASSPDGLSIFKLEGSGSLQGSDAAEALVQAISDPNVDDTYTKLNFIIEEPLIAVDTIGDKHVGDKFTLTGKTNLAVDDEILIEVYSSSFKPTQKTQNGEFSGTTGNVKVVKAESGLNKFSMDIDSSSFKVDEYIVMAQGITQDATGTALFNVLSGTATPAPTQVVIPAVTAPVITAPPTVPPTAAPTIVIPVATETTKSPGFGAIFALAGLGAVAFVVVRRK